MPTYLFHSQVQNLLAIPRLCILIGNNGTLLKKTVQNASYGRDGIANEVYER
jgi:hypothetical protein